MFTALTNIFVDIWKDESHILADLGECLCKALFSSMYVHKFFDVKIEWFTTDCIQLYLAFF